MEAVPQKLLDDPTVDLWLLAPPCQPYTRRGNQRGADDGRAGSFMALLHRLPTLKVRLFLSQEPLVPLCILRPGTSQSGRRNIAANSDSVL